MVDSQNCTSTLIGSKKRLLNQIKTLIYEVNKQKSMHHKSIGQGSLSKHNDQDKMKDKFGPNGIYSGNLITSKIS
jgi:hypothetical protein